MDQFAHHIDLGKHLLQTSPARAAQEFRAALTEAPDSPYAHVLLASALIGEADAVPNRSAEPGDRRGQLLREALQLADDTLALDAEYVTAHIVRARVQIQLDDVLKARKSADTAVKLDPDNDYALSLLAFCHIQLGEYVQSETFIRRACELDPTDESHFLLLSRLLKKQGRREEAWDALQVALKLNPDSSSSHEALGTWYLEDGDFQAALPRLAEALRLNPANRSARTSLILAQTQAGTGPLEKFYWKWHMWHFSMPPHRRDAASRMYGLFILPTYLLPFCYWGIGSGGKDDLTNKPFLQWIFWIFVAPLGLVSTYLVFYNWLLMKRYHRLSGDPKEKPKDIGWTLAFIFVIGFLLFMAIAPRFIK